MALGSHVRAHQVAIRRLGEALPGFAPAFERDPWRNRQPIGPFEHNANAKEPRRQLALIDQRGIVGRRCAAARFLDIGSVLEWPDGLSIAPGVTLRGGREAWERFAETANGHLVGAYVAAQRQLQVVAP